MTQTAFWSRLSTRADIAIIGAGIMGSALAYWLTRLEPTASVVVIERDPGYARASSALSAASIRQQFTTPVNISISQSSIEFLRASGELLAVDEWKPDIGLIEAGYLYLANEGSGLQALRQAHAIQTQHGADVALLAAPELAERFPWLRTADVLAGSLGLRGEGWFDGYSLLTALARKARSQGARFVRGEVTGVRTVGRRVEAVVLGDGSRLPCGSLINAAGPWARAVGRLAGVELPVFARRRTVYVIACRTRMAAFPLLIDPSGFWVRPEGNGFIAGLAPVEDPDDAPLEPDYEAFESVLWPALAARVPAFEAAKLERAWAGYYEMNVFDHNGIVGLHPEIANLGFMNGFSGHGMQQGPVVGRGMAELILHGHFTTLDLSALGIERIAAQRPLRELNVIG
ncbi:MAG TPA: FAD-binding oxidoreductase [Steroidobacteraceae bacterium]